VIGPVIGPGLALGLGAGVVGPLLVGPLLVGPLLVGALLVGALPEAGSLDVGDELGLDGVSLGAAGADDDGAADVGPTLAVGVGLVVDETGFAGVTWRYATSRCFGFDTAQAR
jgi:hypothetical protein